MQSTRRNLLLRRPHFRRVVLSEIVSLLGDWMGFVAVSLLALGDENGVVALALVLVGHNLPTALFAPFAGVLVDRLDRRRLLVLINVAQGALTLGMVAAAALGSVGIVQVLVFARASVGAPLLPVQSAVLRHVVAEDELLEANAITSAAWSIMFSVGMAAGGVIAVFGPAVALAVDAASFGVAALLLRGLPAMVAEGRPGEGGLWDALASVRRDMASAWRHAWERPSLIDAVFAKSPVALANGGGLVLLNLVATRIPFAGTGAFTLGLLHCVRGAGTGVGPLLGAALVRRGFPMARASLLSTWTTFGAIALFSVTQHWVLLLLVTFVWGAGAGCNWVLSSSEIQRLSPDRFVGRMSALDGLAVTLAFCATSLGGAVSVEATGRHAASVWLGLAAGVVGWSGVQWMVRRLERSAARALSPEHTAR